MSLNSGNLFPYFFGSNIKSLVCFSNLGGLRGLDSHLADGTLYGSVFDREHFSERIEVNSALTLSGTNTLIQA